MSADTPLPSLLRLAQSSQVRSLRSPNARLTARGRVCDSTGKCNAPGNAIDGARLTFWDSARQVVTIRVDHSKMPEMWLEIDLSLAQLDAFLGVAQGAEDDENDEMEEEAGEENLLIID